MYDGGLRKAQTDQARAAYDGTVAAYRQTVVSAAQQSVLSTTNQYKAGVVSYLNVITVQTIALNDQIASVQILGRRMVAAVLLIQALGGGWTARDLPTPAAATSP